MVKTLLLKFARLDALFDSTGKLEPFGSWADL